MEALARSLTPALVAHFVMLIVSIGMLKNYRRIRVHGRGLRYYEAWIIIWVFLVATAVAYYLGVRSIVGRDIWLGLEVLAISFLVMMGIYLMPLRYFRGAIQDQPVWMVILQLTGIMTTYVAYLMMQLIGLIVTWLLGAPAPEWAGCILALLLATSMIAHMRMTAIMAAVRSQRELVIR